MVWATNAAWRTRTTGLVVAVRLVVRVRCSLRMVGLTRLPLTGIAGAAAPPLGVVGSAWTGAGAGTGGAGVTTAAGGVSQSSSSSQSSLASAITGIAARTRAARTAESVRSEERRVGKEGRGR